MKLSPPRSEPEKEQVHLPDTFDVRFVSLCLIKKQTYKIFRPASMLKCEPAWCRAPTCYQLVGVEEDLADAPHHGDAELAPLVVVSLARRAGGALAVLDVSECREVLLGLANAREAAAAEDAAGQALLARVLLGEAGLCFDRLPLRGARCARIGSWQQSKISSHWPFRAKSDNRNRRMSSALMIGLNLTTVRRSESKKRRISRLGYLRTSSSGVGESWFSPVRARLKP